MRISPLAALIAIVILGITIEAVEQQSEQAAYALVAILLLGMITFNAQAFSRESGAILSLLGQSSSRKK